MKARGLLAGVAVAVFAVGCATDVGTIDRTQHDRIEKKLFGGVWYVNQTVVDIPYNAAFTFVGEMNFGGTAKVMFDIQEKALVVYPVSEYVEGAEKKWHKEKVFRYWDDACTSADSEKYQCVDGKDNLGRTDKICCFAELYLGQPVQAFPIVSHFDVKRKYNPQTGEQTNVIEENTTDHKWWQRRYIRVDWSKPMIADFAFLGGMVKQDPLSYYIQTFDTDNPDAPTLTEDYIDLVLKIFGDPESAGACDVYGVSYGDCVPATIKIRVAFRKVDVRQDYEPLRYHNEEHNGKFGFFLTERYSYNEDYGTTDSGKLSYINRWNLWARTMEDTEILDADGRPVNKPCFKDLVDTGCDTTNRNGQKEWCSAPNGWFTQGKCMLRKPMPFTKRGLRPIVYHNSPDIPEEMKPGSTRTAEVWSQAIKDTVAWLYFWEEKGLAIGAAQSRACETDADCTQGAILDTIFEIDNPPVPVDAKGKKTRKEAQTVILLGPGNAKTIVDWSYPDGLKTQAGVRLVNLTSDRTVDLAVEGGETLLSGVAPLTADLDPAIPAFNAVAPAVGKKIVVKVGGEVVASLPDVTLQANGVTLFVFDGTNLYKSFALTANTAGLRLINVGPDAVDVSINGGLRYRNLAQGASTGYMEVGGGSTGKFLPADYVPQRLVAMPTGSRGDITCYRFEDFNKCVGYKPELTDKDWDRLVEIKKKLPEMFLMCSNQYDPKVDDKYKSRYYAPWADVTTKAEADLPEMNPCVDFEFNADKMTPEQKLAQAKAMKKIGDTRYSGIYWIPDAEMASPLGYGPSAADPDSGEIFYGVANIYGSLLYYYGALYRDLFDLVNGKLDTENYVSGQYIRDYINAGKGTVGKSSSALTATDIDAIEPPPAVEKPLNTHRSAYEGTGQKPVNPLEVLRMLRDKNIQQQLMKGLPVVDPNLGANRLSVIKGTAFEDLMINDEVKLAVSAGKIQPGMPLTAEDREALSPVNWGNLGKILAKERARQSLLERNNYCFADFNDEGMIGIAKSWACLPGDTRPVCGPDFNPLDHSLDHDNPCCIDDGDKLASAIAVRFYTAVVEHEVGHTVGLRHHFSASNDLFNYPDRYFDIREREPIPCSRDEECEAVEGEICLDGFCAIQPQTTCKKATDCGYADSYDCVSGQCMALKRCGVRGECGPGETCDGDTRWCYKDGKRIETAVKAPADKKVYKMIPRPHMTPKEAELSRNVYQYSSIMDYGQRWNSDILDIGKYDRAAIRFGYGQLLDVYEDTRRLTDSLHKYAQLYGYTDAQNSDTFDTSWWNGGVFFSQFYYLQNFIGVDENRSEGEFWKNRAAYPYEWIKNEHNAMTNYYRQLLDWTYVTVPYKFDSDEYNGNVGTYTWDTGVDILEIVHNMKIQLTEYYLMDAFKRERFGFGRNGDPTSYFNRVLTRYMDPMRGAAMYYALYSHLLKNYGVFRAIWSNGRLQGWALRRASETGFEVLANSLASPAPGSYKLDPATGIYTNFSYETKEKGSELDISLGDGKYPYTQFMDQAGYFYWNHALWIGSFWEKMAALLTLTDSTVYFTTNYVGEQLNIGVGTSIGFNTLYATSLTQLFGGLVAGDASKFAWTVDGKTPKPRAYFDEKNEKSYETTPAGFGELVEYPKGTKFVEPSIDNLTMKLYLMIYGLAYLPASFDPTFLDSFAICMKGNGNCYTLAQSSGIQWEEFSDPFGGKTFLAWQPTYAKDWFAPNVALIRKANALKQQWLDAKDDAKPAVELELRKTVEILDLMRGAYEVFSAMKI